MRTLSSSASKSATRRRSASTSWSRPGVRFLIDLMDEEGDDRAEASDAQASADFRSFIEFQPEAPRTKGYWSSFFAFTSFFSSHSIGNIQMPRMSAAREDGRPSLRFEPAPLSLGPG